MMPKYMQSLLLNMLTLLTPILLVLGAVLMMLTPIFIRTEYNLPNFPADKYGFTMEERLYWAEISRSYLVSDHPEDYLSEFQLDDGTPLYNERELRHMVDVKAVIHFAQQVFYLVLVAFALISVWAFRSDSRDSYLAALSRGGWLTVGLLAAMITAVILNFDAFFVAFHRVFFEGETWIFKYSDTLIRLFPIRFWQDAFILVGGLVLGVGAFFGYFFRRHA
ncbi:MAG: TIGR01906 family membrane protein [Chloroflexota bacterium]